MTPEMILLTIQEASKALAEMCKLAQTPEGQALMRRVAEDRVAWDSFWAKTGSDLRGFFQFSATQL